MEGNKIINQSQSGNFYLDKFGFIQPYISEEPAAGLNMVVVIPCYNESNLIKVLNSLKSCHETKLPVEVIVVINSGMQDATEVLQTNEKTLKEFILFSEINSNAKLKFHSINAPGLPSKQAGVGLARKIGMDEAVARFHHLNNDSGIIICLDADCEVEKNYLAEIEKLFFENPKTNGCSIYFEHGLDGTEFDEKIYEGIINYELFLRYYKLSLKWTGFPYHFHTIGSCMAVRSEIYQKQGGMNKRKAGEDFYFLHKVFPLKKFAELNSTCVYPSPRKSDRVPFGTGNAITKFTESNTDKYPVYDFQSFEDIKALFGEIQKHNLNFNSANEKHLSTCMIAFLESENFFAYKLNEIKSNSASSKTFIQRFFNYFDGFKILKFVHFARDHFYKNELIETAVNNLMRKSGIESVNLSKKDLLLELRKFEKKEAAPFNPST